METLKYKFNLSDSISYSQTKWLSALVLVLILASCGQQTKKESTMENTTEETKATPAIPEAPEWSKNATIYELNIRQFSEEGTFNAILSHVPRIKDMGIKVVWLMPIHPIGEKNRKGPMGSYYAVKDYKAVNPEFGTLEDFKHLVDAFHEHDIKVIIDWVANHSSPDNVWFNEHKDWYNLDSAGNTMPPKDTDWTDVADLNYENQEMRAAMQEAMSYWVKECNIDGFRCDVAFMVPIDFWNETRVKLDSIKPMFMLAEGESPELHEKAFDMTYAWEFMHLANEVAVGKKPLSAVKEYMQKQDSLYSEKDYRMYFSTNHDENSWNGTSQERYGKNEDVMHVLHYTLDGMPLLYSGQESGENKRLEFFEKDAIDWGTYERADFYTTLLNLNRENKALWNGKYGAKTQFIDNTHSDKVLSYSRFKDGYNVLVVLNFSDEDLDITLTNNSDASLEATELFSGEKVTLASPFDLAVPAHGYKVFTSNP